jgi:hypothetical protein
MSASRRSLLIIVAATTVWYGCTLALWAARSLNDWVPAGVDYTVQPPKSISIEVQCNSLFDGQARDDTPLPVLKSQPVGAPELGYQRDACEMVHNQARTVFAVDTAMFVAVLGIGGWLMLRRSRRDIDHAALAPG